MGFVLCDVEYSLNNLSEDVLQTNFTFETWLKKPKTTNLRYILEYYRDSFDYGTRIYINKESKKVYVTKFYIKDDLGIDYDEDLDMSVRHINFNILSFDFKPVEISAKFNHTIRDGYMRLKDYFDECEINKRLKDKTKVYYDVNQGFAHVYRIEEVKKVNKEIEGGYGFLSVFKIPRKKQKKQLLSNNASEKTDIRTHGDYQFDYTRYNDLDISDEIKHKLSMHGFGKQVSNFEMAKYIKNDIYNILKIKLYSNELLATKITQNVEDSFKILRDNIEQLVVDLDFVSCFEENSSLEVTDDVKEFYRTKVENKKQSIKEILETNDKVLKELTEISYNLSELGKLSKDDIDNYTDNIRSLSTVIHDVVNNNNQNND